MKMNLEGVMEAVRVSERAYAEAEAWVIGSGKTASQLAAEIGLRDDQLLELGTLIEAHNRLTQQALATSAPMLTTLTLPSMLAAELYGEFKVRHALSDDVMRRAYVLASLVLAMSPLVPDAVSQG
ncbi:hypothetical protein [Deinococcus kurensis]|uniref:hypothetical protein n=1 Tax=Deinococcus kurensis TaxID=2662757 RepID=UPI0012D2F386|nr:hypothetical protein [Deinococcus kurensis]